MRYPKNWFTKTILAAGVTALCGTAFAATTLKLSHNQGVNVPVHKAMEFFAKKVGEYTNGELKVRVYPNAQLGTQRESVELVQKGAIAFAKSNAAEMEAFEPLYGVFNLPYIFHDRDHYYKVLEGDIGNTILDASKDKGFIGITYYDGGSRSFYAKKAINSPDDLNGMKVRVQPSPSAVKMVELLGGNPTPIAWGELYTALQQGVVDAAENNVSALTDGRHGEIAKFYSKDEHTMIPDVLVMSTQIWDTLTPEQQAAIKKAGHESMLKQKELWTEADTKNIEKAKKMGVTFVTVDKAPFREKTASMIEEAKKVSPEHKKLIEEIQSIQ